MDFRAKFDAIKSDGYRSDVFMEPAWNASRDAVKLEIGAEIFEVDAATLGHMALCCLRVMQESKRGD